MRILVVAPYPPRRCGVGIYARDHVERLRAAGNQVTVLSPPDGDGDVKAPFLGGRAFLRAARMGAGFDGVMVHFQPSLYYRPRRALSKVLTSLSFLVLAVARGGVLDIVVHEADAPKLWRPDYLLLRWVFRLAGQVSFHTEAERAELERQYRVTVRGRLTPHQVFPPDHPTRLEARRRLEIPAGEGPVYLCAGFLHRSKGFDRAVAAFASSEANGASLYIVGSVRDPTPDNLAYAADLAERARRTPGVTLIARFVSDEEFDLWMAAADRVVLPYRRSWSSGILARAHALGTPAVVSAVGGLAEQADEHDVVVHDDAELARAMGAAPVPGGSA